jgi:hypothetical protein
MIRFRIVVQNCSYIQNNIFSCQTFVDINIMSYIFWWDLLLFFVAWADLPALIPAAGVLAHGRHEALHRIKIR